MANSSISLFKPFAQKNVCLLDVDQVSFASIYSPKTFFREHKEVVLLLRTSEGAT